MFMLYPCFEDYIPWPNTLSVKQHLGMVWNAIDISCQTYYVPIEAFNHGMIITNSDVHPMISHELWGLYLVYTWTNTPTGTELHANFDAHPSKHQWSYRKSRRCQKKKKKLESASCFSRALGRHHGHWPCSETVSEHLDFFCKQVITSYQLSNRWLGIHVEVLFFPLRCQVARN